MGPTSCANEYSATITSFKINNGSQTFDPIANPGVTFNAQGSYSFNETVHVANQSQQGNTNPGYYLTGQNFYNFVQTGCSGPVNPNQNDTMGGSVPSPFDHESIVQSVTVSAGSSNVYFNVNWVATPTAPRNLVTTTGNTQVSLSWQAPTEDGGYPITNYKIYRSASSGSETLFKEIGNVNSYNDSNVTSGQEYYYKVTAVNYIGESSQSNEANATALAGTAPNAPTNLAAAAISSSQINLSWTAPSNNGISAITGYKIERLQGNSAIWSTIVSNTSSTATTYSDTGLAASTSYTYRVSAINPVGTSFPSNTASATTHTTTQNTSANTIIAKITTWDNTSGNPGTPQVNLSAVNPQTGMVYVVEDDTVAYQYAPHDHFIAVIDGATNTLVAEIQTQAIARGIVVNPNTDLIYATINGTVTIINGATNSISATIPVPGANGIGVNPATDLVYVSGSGNKITVIDGRTDAIATTIAVGTNPGSIGVNPVTDKIYVQNQGVWEPTPPAGYTLEYYSVSVIDGSTNTVTDTLPLAVGLIAVNQNTDKIYAQSGTSLYVINGTTDSYSTVPIAVSCLGINQGTNKIYACPGANLGPTLEIINGSTDTVMCSLTGFNAAVAAVANPSTDRIYVSDSMAFAVYVVNGSSNNNCAPPSAPQNLAATAGNSRVSLAWMAPASSGGPAITGYEIERALGDLSFNGFANSTNTTFFSQGNTTSFEDTGLASGTTYNYTVFAKNAAGTSQASNTASATTFTVPSQPNGLMATAVSSSQISLSWAAPSSNGGSAIIGYDIQRSADNGATWSTVVSNTGSTSTTYSDTGLTSGTTYTYMVSTINSAGTSQPSNTASATTFAVPSPPTGLAAITVSPVSMNLSWSAPSSNGGSAITGYKIMISTDGSNFTTLVNDTNNAGTTVSVSGLHPHTTYYFEVSAINSVGTSALSNVAPAATR